MCRSCARGGQVGEERERERVQRQTPEPPPPHSEELRQDCWPQENIGRVEAGVEVVL
jgi:hypothetical protein